jgi:hypothetical protein
LHAGGAIALHCPGRYPVTTAESQCGNASDIGFVFAGHHAAKNDFIEVVWCKGLAGEQWFSGRYGQV